MIHLREGRFGAVDLDGSDLTWLDERLGGLIESRVQQGRVEICVRRRVGIWALPSGRTLVVEPYKGRGADVLAWMAAVDPGLRGLRTAGLARSGGGAGDVASALVRVFCGLLTRRLATDGQRHAYHLVDGDLPFVRGRIRFEAVGRRVGRATVPCRYWERRPDTPLNRLLAAALQHIVRHPHLGAAAGVEGRRLQRNFASVPIGYPPTMLDLDRPLPRLVAAYEPLRTLAVMLLRGDGQAMGGVGHALAFSVDVERLFERTVEMLIRRESWARPPRFQAPLAYRADGQVQRLRADAVVYPDPDAPVIVDAKYAHRFRPAHLHQLLAYLRLGDARRGALIYPAGGEAKPATMESERPGEWRVDVVEIDVAALGVGTAGDGRGRSAGADLGALTGRSGRRPAPQMFA